MRSIEDVRRQQRPGGAGRTPPHDLQAEESLLGAMLLSRDAVSVALEQCATTDFYKPAHGHVFDAVGALYTRGDPVDPVTVADELRRAGLLELIGGPEALIRLQAATPATSNAGRYARIVADHALLRRLIGVASEISDMGYDVPENVAEAIDRAETMVFEVGQRRVAETLAPIRDLLSESLDRLEALYDRGEAITGIPTGYTDLDEQLSGLQPSNLLIVGARPATGKALALDTPLPTPTGWTTMGEVRVGEAVLDEHGRPCRVDYVSPVFVGNRCFRVWFEDGTSIVADAGHRWLASNDGGAPPRVLTTEEMLAEGVRHRNRPHWYIAVTGPIDLPEEDLPVEPYVVGARLGQGCAVQPLLPHQYLRGSAKQRSELLRGLLDSAGTIHGSGRAELRLTSRALLDQAWELVCSLGFRPWPARESVETGADGSPETAWSFSWTPRRDGPRPRRAILAIDEEPSVPVRCIAVSSESHLFLAGRSMVPTHNTAFALGIVSHAAMEAQEPVLFFSLEMSHLEITQRLLCAEARVDSSRMRNGRLQDSDWSKISHAIGRLGEAPIFIDDNPNLTVMDIRAKARRLKSREGLGLVVVDYLQLMTGRSQAENRQVEVSEISRGLKILARELEVPVIALSQLSRNLEQRADKRPMLADLRESGCMPADTRLYRADDGTSVSLGELILTQEQPLVWSLDDHWRLVPRRVTKVFPSGIRPVFRLRLASGAEVTATANHPFRRVDGWVPLDELQAGDHIAVPRRLPEPTNPAPAWSDNELILLAHLLGDGSIGPQGVKYATADPANKNVVERAGRELFGIEVAGKKQRNTWLLWFPSPYRLTHHVYHPIRNWLEPLGLWGSRSHNKFIPGEVMGQSSDRLALFLSHLWATDGSITISRNARGSLVRIYYATSSRRLADDVRAALLRLDIQARVSPARKAGYRDNWHVSVTGKENQERFLSLVGCYGGRGDVIPAALEIVRGLKGNPNVDVVPCDIGVEIREAMAEAGVTHRKMAESLGEQYCGSYLPGSPSGRQRRFSRSRLAQIAEVVNHNGLADLANSDVLWDQVVEITALGDQPTYDATVEDTHNFIAEGVIAHNSLEQDADVVMFLYRDELYNPESSDRGTAEVIVAKHRNGPTGTARLAFLDHYARFANMARSM